MIWNRKKRHRSPNRNMLPAARPHLEPLEDRLALSLAYHGGAVIPNVEVSSVYLGQAWESSDYPRLLDNYFQYLTDSPYIDVLAQYGAGPGFFAGNDVVPMDLPAGSYLDDSDIQALLETEINDGYLPIPGGNDVFVVFTPPEVTVTFGDYVSGIDFFGYHDVFVDSYGVPVIYAVVPFPDDAGPDLGWFQSLTETSAHELAEMITDPTFAGWYDPFTGDEIGDYCNESNGILNGFAVQYVWSNEDNACVLPADFAALDLRTAVAEQFTFSDEYFANFITDDYQQLLGRTPSWSELSYWLSVMRSGATDEQVLAGFLGSAEYYWRQGGGDDAWLEGVYLDLLGRAPDSLGEAYWLDRLSTDLDHGGVAYFIATSWERGALVVSSYYDFFLGRSAGDTEIAYWVSSLTQGLTKEEMAASFVASEEYYFYHYGSSSNWLVGIYQDLLGREADQGGYDYWMAILA